MNTSSILFTYLLAVFFFPAPAQSTISDNFRAFVQSRFGRAVANLLARDDLGEIGSYGGGEDHVAGQKTEWVFRVV
jgi:hypothetical protein